MTALPSKRQVLENLSELDPDQLYEAVARAMAAGRHHPEMPQSCPNCGCNFKNDYLIDRDGFVIDPRGQAFYRGADLGLTATQVCIFHSIAKENGRYVRTETITSRCCRERNGWPPKTVHVHLHRIRKALAIAGAPDPISNERGRGSTLGYRWISQKELQT